MSEPPAKVQRVEYKYSNWEHVHEDFLKKTDENIESKSKEQSPKVEVKSQPPQPVPLYINDPEYLNFLGHLLQQKKIIVDQLTHLTLGYRTYFEYSKYVNKRLVELFFLQLNILPDEIYFNMVFKEQEYKDKLLFVKKRILQIEIMCVEVLKKKNKFNSELLYFSCKFPLLYQIIKPFY